MPWKIVRMGNGYAVKTIATGEKHTKHPMKLSQAKAQLRIMAAAEPGAAKGKKS